MIALAYAVPTGVAAGWAGVLDMILTPAKVSQVGETQAHACTDTLHLPKTESFISALKRWISFECVYIFYLIVGQKFCRLFKAHAEDKTTLF